MAVADLNGDGNLDVVTANSISNDASVLLGREDGKFDTRGLVAVGESPIAIELADLDANGTMDLITANADSEDLSVWFGEGDGTFDNRMEIPLDAQPQKVIAVRLDADGFIDLVTMNPASADISVLLGLGNGMFNDPQRVSTSGSSPVDIAVADVNMDVIPDLVVANSTDSEARNNIIVLLGRGDGTFFTDRCGDCSAGISPRSVKVADVSSVTILGVPDGVPDIVTANSFLNNISVLPGRGDGTFGADQCVAQLRCKVGAVPVALEVVDVNNDNMMDVITVNSLSNNISVLLNRADNSLFERAQFFPVGQTPLSMALADTNNDGMPEPDRLFIANFDSGTVSVLANNNDGTFVPR